MWGEHRRRFRERLVGDAVHVVQSHVAQSLRQRRPAFVALKLFLGRKNKPNETKRNRQKRNHQKRNRQKRNSLKNETVSNSKRITYVRTYGFGDDDRLQRYIRTGLYVIRQHTDHVVPLAEPLGCLLYTSPSPRD